MKNLEKRIRILEQKIRPTADIKQVIFDSTFEEFNEAIIDYPDGKREVNKLSKSISFEDFMDRVKQKSNCKISSLLHICELNENNMQIITS